MRLPVNLASRPFRNEKLPALLFGLGAAAVLALTAEHAFVVRRLLPARTSALHQEVAALEAEIGTLRVEAAELTAPRPDPKVLAQWSIVKGLVDRRAFRWTELFSRLEEVQPGGVRLVSIAPAIKGEEVELDLAAVVRSAEEGFEFVRVLQERRDFTDVYPVSVGEGAAGNEFRYTMRYRPGAGSASRAASPEGKGAP